MLKLEIIGNLGAAAEKKTVNGSTFVSMNVAHSEKFVDKTTGEIASSTTWISVTVSHNIDNILPYLVSGTKVFVRGFMRLKVYTGHDGQKHAGVNVSATELELCGGIQQVQAQKAQSENENNNDNNKPF